MKEREGGDDDEGGGIREKGRKKHGRDETGKETCGGSKEEMKLVREEDEEIEVKETRQKYDKRRKKSMKRGRNESNEGGGNKGEKRALREEGFRKKEKK